ncbi:pcp-5 [Pristionchus pacificus]|uniref:Pcp-5 n=1 Tax=Pristionchus pacificus TaxID=54126 RepID=A0A2A6CQY5_PRIPA|nr:pcp-5 [Pristionchus pacificus]|eukprot:PDM80506.1 pcp-5 [Pristionchus pacificus]
MIPLLLLSLSSPSFSILRDPAGFHSGPIDLSSTKTGYKGYKYQEEFLSGVPIDHFAFTTNQTFSLRYFFNDEHFQCQKTILFYTGNEGKLEGFAENTGFMWDIAPEFEAAVIFAEHRFYGKSQPFGNDSYSSIDKLGFLSSEQALADFAFLIEHLKTKRIKCAQHSSVIAFGGSYGGMLSAWMRIKYPHLVQGAIAASAPVFWFFDSGIEEDIYDRIVTRTATSSGCELKAVTSGFEAISNLGKTDNGRDFLNKLFVLEEKSSLIKPEDTNFLKAFIKEVFESIVMVDYPYPTSFLSPLPGWPVKLACSFLKNVSKNDEDAARSLFNVVNLYYNYTGSTPSFCANPDVCSGAFAALGDPLGWPWQTCTEMVMPLCSSGYPNDFFWKDCPYTEKTAIDYCTKTFGSIGFTRGILRPKWATRNYGINSFPTATNIVFSNGFLDPWSGGGWSKENKKEGSLIGIIIEEGAHHYDLRGTHSNDTQEIKDVRDMERGYIKDWVKEYETKWKEEKKKWKESKENATRSFH